MKVDVLGIKIDSLAKNDLIQKLEDRLGLPEPVFIVTPYSEMLVHAQKETEFKKILNSADFAIPDGIGVMWSANYLSTAKNHQSTFKKFLTLISSLIQIVFSPGSIRYPIPEKISGAEFVWDLAEIAERQSYSIYLLGGYDDTPQTAANKLKEKHPNLKIAGFSNKLDEETVKQVNGSGADFLFVALGPVRQEKWIYKNLKKLKIKLAIGLGGTFDYLAEKRRYRPKIWSLRGLEWLFRLITQPWRTFRIIKGVGGLIFYTFHAIIARRN